MYKKLFTKKMGLLCAALFEAVFICWLLFRFLLDGFSLQTLLTAIPGGIMIFLLPIVYESYLFDKFRTRKSRLLVKMLSYVVVPFTMLFLYEILFTQLSTRNLLLSFFVMVFFLYINQYAAFVNTTLGSRALMRFYTGRYIQPVEEEKAVMFLDLNASTSIAEKLGHKRFLLLLNDFFRDICEFVLEHNGEIYKYVGDEIIILWEATDIQKGEPFLAFNDMKNRIGQRKGYYQEQYGVDVDFTAGLHLGTVYAGEVGSFRKEIAFIGDTVNTASRLERECKRFNCRLIYTGGIKSAATNVVTAERLGRIRLRGKVSETEIYGVH